MTDAEKPGLEQLRARLVDMDAKELAVFCDVALNVVVVAEATFAQRFPVDYGVWEAGIDARRGGGDRVEGS